MTIVQNSTFYWNTIGFQRPFTTGVVCQQGTLTPPEPGNALLGACICSTCWGQSLSRTGYFSWLCYSNIHRYFLDFAVYHNAKRYTSVARLRLSKQNSSMHLVSCLRSIIIFTVNERLKSEFHLKSSFRKFYGRNGDLIEQYGVTLSRMLNDILTFDQQWLPYRSDFPPISWPLYRAWPSPNYEWFPWSICNGCG